MVIYFSSSNPISSNSIYNKQINNKVNIYFIIFFCYNSIL